MAVATRIEMQIIRRLLQDRQRGTVQPGAAEPRKLHGHTNPWADRLIAILAVTAGLVIMGSYLEELLWLVVAGATVFTLR
jgi:hypothetical protein